MVLALKTVASAPDTVVVDIVALSNWYIVPMVEATVAVDIADMGLVVVASLSPLQRYTMHFQFDVYI